MSHYSGCTVWQVPETEKRKRKKKKAHKEYYCNNDFSKESEQKLFWSFVSNTLQPLKKKHALFMEKLSADLDAYEVIETSSKAPTVQELETATKDGWRWTKTTPYQLIDKDETVVKKSSNAPKCEEIKDDKEEGYRWDTITTTKTEATYQLIKPAQYADKIFALLDFDIRDPDERPLDTAAIREELLPDPQDFVYVELRHEIPKTPKTPETRKIKGYIKIRNFIQIVQFLADSSYASGNRELIGRGNAPPKFTPDRLVSYKGNYVWLPARSRDKEGPDTIRRDLELFNWFYTLYQLSVVDTTKLPQVPVTISK